MKIQNWISTASIRGKRIRVDTTVEEDTPEGETVTVGLLKQKNNFTMSKLAERCHDTDILKDAKLLDAISSALEDNESSPRLTTFVIQTKANLRKWRRSLKARIQLSDDDNGGGDEVIEVDTAEVIDERCGHVVIDPKDDNKCAECREQYKERDCNEWLECPMCKQWYHNEECFL